MDSVFVGETTLSYFKPKKRACFSNLEKAKQGIYMLSGSHLSYSDFEWAVFEQEGERKVYAYLKNDATKGHTQWTMEIYEMKIQ